VAKKVKKGKREQALTDFKTLLFKKDPGRLEKQEHSCALFIDLNSDNRDDYLFIESRNWLKKKRVILYTGRKKQLKKSLDIGKYVTPVARYFDVNSDGINDLVLFDHGKKQEGHFSFTGSRPVLLLGSPNGKLIDDTSISNAYMEILEEVHEGDLAAVHGGVQVDEKVSAKWFDFGDIDNDGDIDIWVESSGGMNVNSHFLINENGSYTVDRNRIPNEILDGPLDSDFYRYHTSKFIDVNKDGHLDIVLGQHKTGSTFHINQSSRFFINNDGHRDILINYNSTSVKYEAPTILINNGSGKLLPSSFQEAVSSDLEKDDVFSWSESNNDVKLWRFATKGEGIEYLKLNDSASNYSSTVRSLISSSVHHLSVEKTEDFQELTAYDSTF